MLKQLVTRLTTPAILAALVGSALIAGAGSAHAELGPRFSPNEPGNYPWLSYPIFDPRPDLTVQNLVADCEAGQLTIVFRTLNQGNGMAATSFTNIALDGQVTNHLQDQPLVSGQARQHGLTTNVSENYQHTVTVTVDAQNQVIESNELNNSVTVPVTTQWGC